MSEYSVRWPTWLRQRTTFRYRGITGAAWRLATRIPIRGGSTVAKVVVKAGKTRNWHSTYSARARFAIVGAEEGNPDVSDSFPHCVNHLANDLYPPGNTLRIALDRLDVFEGDVHMAASTR